MAAKRKLAALIDIKFCLPPFEAHLHEPAHDPVPSLHALIHTTPRNAEAAKKGKNKMAKSGTEKTPSGALMPAMTA